MNHSMKWARERDGEWVREQEAENRTERETQWNKNHFHLFDELIDLITAHLFEWNEWGKSERDARVEFLWEMRLTYI